MRRFRKPICYYQCNWCGVMYSVFHENALINGEEAAPGQVVIALRDGGLRANGRTSARKALAMRFGRKWWNVPEAKKYIKGLLPNSVFVTFCPK